MSQYTPHERFADEADSYLDKHNIYELFSHLLKNLAIHMPKDPYSFMLEVLDQPVNTKKIIVTGPPGSGQEVYVKNIVEEFDVVHIRVESLTREEVENKTPIGEEIKSYNDKKEPVPESLITKMIETRIAKPDCIAQGWVLDGYPTTRSQAQSLQMEGVLCNKFVLLCSDRDSCMRNAKTSMLYSAFKESQLVDMYTEFERNVKQYVDLFSDVRALINVEEDEGNTWNNIKTFLEKSPISKAPRRPMRVLVMGPRGAGKATQCIKLSNKYKLVHVSVGSLLRKEMDRSKTFKETVQPFVDAGACVPDDVVIPIVINRLLQPDCKSSGWLLDGFPRSVGQAEALEKAGLNPNRAVCIEADEEVCLKRCTNTREDPQTGNIYNLDIATPPVIIGNRLIQKNRDTEAVVRSLLTNYKATSSSLFERYGHILKKFDGTTDPDALFGLIEHYLLSALGSVA